LCPLPESDNHLFFLCQITSEVWARSNFNFPLHLLDPMEDRIQNALTNFQIHSLQEHKLTLFLITAWYICRARNDLRFQRKQWTHHQILHAATSHLNALLTDTESTNLNTPQPQTPIPSQQHHQPDPITYHSTHKSTKPMML
jgi:hypothetical protein